MKPHTTPDSYLATEGLLQLKVQAALHHRHLFHPPTIRPHSASLSRPLARLLACVPPSFKFISSLPRVLSTLLVCSVTTG